MTKLATRWIASFDPTDLANGEYAALSPPVVIDVDDASTVFGSPLFLASDGNCDRANAAAIATMPCRFIALESGSGTGKLTLRHGYVRNTSWSWTVGGEIYVGDTIGTLVQTAPVGTSDVPQSIGFAFTADIILVEIGGFSEKAAS